MFRILFLSLSLSSKRFSFNFVTWQPGYLYLFLLVTVSVKRNIAFFRGNRWRLESQGLNIAPRTIDVKVEWRIVGEISSLVLFQSGKRIHAIVFCTYPCTHWKQLERHDYRGRRMMKFALRRTLTNNLGQHRDIGYSPSGQRTRNVDIAGCYTYRGRPLLFEEKEIDRGAPPR